MTPEEMLGRHHLFSVLEPAETGSLLKLVSVRRCQSGETVFRREDAGDGLYGVLTGKVVVTVQSEAGKELILNMFQPGEFFGEIALLDGKGRTATAVAREPSELLFLGRNVFLLFAERHPQILIRMIALLCDRLRRTTHLVEDAAFLNVTTRLAKLLLALAVPGEGAASIKISQAELAEMIGVSREAVSKQLSQWREAGVIELGRQQLVIRIPAYLEAIVGFG
jgi:CRP/FNR family cyclic AMP-dependent transcriptional regulator